MDNTHKEIVKNFKVSYLDIIIDNKNNHYPISNRISFKFKDDKGNDVFISLTKQEVFSKLFEHVIKY